MAWANEPKRLPSARRNLRRSVFRTVLCGSVSLLALTSMALANPQGGEVAAGSATISTPSSTSTTVTQQSDKAIINWQSFNVKKDESVNFVQPGASSITLNRIFDSNPSVIAGLVTANGRLILVNRNGMVFEGSSMIDTAGLIATSADITDANFLAGRYQFDIPGSPTAQISNAGTITAQPGGLVAMVAPTVENSGIITAKLGRIGLGSGSTFVLDLQGEDLVSFPISEELARQLAGTDGELDGASVILSSNAARSVIDDVLKLPGDTIASSITRTGDTVWLTGPQPWLSVQSSAGGTVTAGGVLDVSGATGGSIALTGDNVHATGTLKADGTTGAGGAVSIAASSYGTVSGVISANGASGGSVVVGARNLLTSGRIEASGTNGAGGSVTLAAANQHTATTTTQVSANGTTKGGTIDVAGGTATTAVGLFTSGSYSATSSSGVGGNVNIAGRNIKLIDAKVDASGATGGGKIAVGFTGDGATRSINAENILVSPTTRLSADATQNGNGGSVVFWSNLASDFMGTITAKGGSLGGNGGFLEISSRGEVGFYGLGDASAANGFAGSLSLDPKNLIISTPGTDIPGYQLIDAGSASTTFGDDVELLATGNTVVTAPGDDTAATNAGAVFVYNTGTGALVSMITGETAEDAVGNGGITALSNGNFVFVSTTWDNGAAADAGAATFGNGTTGVAGVVSASNSLVGSAAGNQVGSGGVTALTNGNYVVSSSAWDDGATADVGAVTWGNGSTGTFGTVSAANSIIGSTANDAVGSGGITALSNGNYVIRSLTWDNGAAADAGAVTWANGGGGTAGAITSLNSLVGTTAGDQIGSSGVTALTNGNFVVASSLWDNGAIADAGAVTWGNGSSGTFGAVSAANSLVGTAANNEVGNGGVVALSNGNYVAISSNWDNGATANVGAVTWGDGASGTTGSVGVANSLVGTTANNSVGSGGVTALTNGNYVVISPTWDDGALANVGAVTWRDGTGPSAGTVSAANSLVGSLANDSIGNGGVTALTNGNYVVASPNRSVSLAVSDAGAATWGNGTTGITGTISAANSLIGSTVDDVVASNGIVALANGNYVVVSPFWDNGAVNTAGAVTWGNGTTGIVGTISAANSLVGSSASDQVGLNGVAALTNGNYVVASSFWDNGATVDVGAATWGNGTTGISGTISAANSLIGTIADDHVSGAGIVALMNGNYAVSSPLWDNGGADSGAVTIGVGGGGTVGLITTANSLIGTFDSELIFAAASPTGEVVARAQDAPLLLVGLTDPGQITFSRAAGNTLTVGTSFITSTLNTGTAVALQASNDITLLADLIVNNPTGNGGALTLQAGRSVLLNADITTDNGNLTIIANEVLTAGVIDIHRDPGAAVLEMAAGADIDAGTGNVRLTIAPGTGKTNTTSGDMTLRNVTGGTIIAENLGPTNGNVVLESGALTASGSGSPLVVAALGGNFINNAGAAALSTPSGRWIVYSQNAGANTPGGLTANPYYNTVYNPLAPTAIPSAGNRFAYTIAPVLTVTADNAARLYGDPDPAFTFQVTGLIGGDTLGAAVAGTPSFTTTATPSSPVNGGPYAINPALGTLVSDFNYGFTFAPGVLTINAATLTYLATPTVREYGDPNPVLTGSLVGFKNGETVETATTGTLAWTTSATQGSALGSYEILGSGLTANNGNYVFVQDPGNATALTITQAQLMYVADPVVRLYGQANPGTFTGTVTGFKFTDTLATTTTGTASFSTAATQSSNAGSYAIDGSGLTVTNANYVLVQAASNATALTINPATLTYTADPKNRIYGDPDPAFTGTVTGFVLGETEASATTGTMTFTTPATATSNVGSHAIDGGGLTANNGNYVFVQAASNATALTINPATLTYLADAQSRPYGDPDPAYTGTVTGFKNGETQGTATTGILTFTTPATATSNVGTYALNGSGLTANNGNYVFVQDPTNATALTINPATLTYIADPKSRAYGDPNPVLTGVVSGFKNGETVATATTGTLAWTTTATGTTNVGSYAITGAGLTANNGNYVFVQDPANATALTINQAQLTYLADPKNRLYGAADPTLTGTVAGLKNGETLDSATTGTLAWSTTATPTSNVGTYAIEGSGLTVTNANYTLAQAASNATAFVINPATLTYTADPQSRLYGDPNPTLTGTLTGFVLGETEATATTGALTWTTPATESSFPGTYAINGGGLTANNGNYVFVQDPGNATALLIESNFSVAGIDLAQLLKEGDLAGDGVFEHEEGASSKNENAIDHDAGKPPCVLNAPEARRPGDCNGTSSAP